MTDPRKAFFDVLNGRTAYDGDTFYEDGESNRVVGYDAPEVSPARPGAQAAAAFFQSLIDDGATFDPVGTDRYGRQLVEGTTAQGDRIDEAMLAAGLAQPYQKDMTAGDQGLAFSAMGRQLVPGLRTPYDEAVVADRQTLAPFTPDFTRGPMFPVDNYDGTFSRAVSRGTDNMQASMYAAANAIGSFVGWDGLEDWGAEGAMRNLQEAAARPAKIESWDDVDSLSSFWTKFVETIGEQVPNLGTMIAGGGVGALGGRLAAAGAAKSLLRKVAHAKATKGLVGPVSDDLVNQMARQIGAKQGAIAGAAAVNYPMQAGEVQLALQERGIDSPGSALLAGIPSTALDVFGLERMVSTVFKGFDRNMAMSIADQIGTALKERGLLSAGGVAALNLIKQAGKGAATGVMVEAPTEATQELIKLAAIKANDPTFDIFSPEGLASLREAAISGAVVGGAFSGVGRGGTAALNTTYEMLARGQTPPGEQTAGDQPPAAEPTQAPAAQAPAAQAPAAQAPAAQAPDTSWARRDPNDPEVVAARRKLSRQRKAISAQRQGTGEEVLDRDAVSHLEEEQQIVYRSLPDSELRRKVTGKRAHEAALRREAEEIAKKNALGVRVYRGEREITPADRLDLAERINREAAAIEEILTARGAPLIEPGPSGTVPETLEQLRAQAEGYARGERGLLYVDRKANDPVVKQLMTEYGLSRIRAPGGGVYLYKGQPDRIRAQAATDAERAAGDDRNAIERIRAEAGEFQQAKPDLDPNANPRVRQTVGSTGQVIKEEVVDDNAGRPAANQTDVPVEEVIASRGVDPAAAAAAWGFTQADAVRPEELGGQPTAQQPAAQAEPQPDQQPAAQQPAAQQPAAPKMRVQMTFAYGKDKRSEVKASTTFDAILSGERTSTLRLDGWRGTERWAAIQPGDIVEFVGKNNATVQVEVVGVQRFEDASALDAEAVSRTEGWSVEALRGKYLPAGKGGYYVQYRLQQPAAQQPTAQQPAAQAQPAAQTSASIRRINELMVSWLEPLGIPASMMPTVVLGTFEKASRRGQYDKGTNQITLTEDMLDLVNGRARDRLLKIEVLAHEVGHFIDYYIQDTASPEERAAMEQAYQAWRTKYEQTTPYKARVARATGLAAASFAETRRQTAAAGVTPADSSHPRMQYQLERNEWFADQIARDLLGQSIEADSPALTALVKRASDMFRRFYRAIAKEFGWPVSDAAVADFLSRMRAAQQPAQPAAQAEPVPSAAVEVWYGANRNRELSNLAERPFTDENGRQYRSVEHAYQSWKSGAFDEETYAKYQTAKPGSKIAGRKGKKTDGNWHIGLMERLIRRSFQQNPEAAARLLETGDAVITHDRDRGVWRTAFPAILMKVRSELRSTPDQQTAAQQPQGSSPTITVDGALSWRPADWDGLVYRQPVAVESDNSVYYLPPVPAQQAFYGVQRQINALAQLLRCIRS